MPLGIVDRWPSWFTQQYDHVWPDRYVCIDCEYTGPHATFDYVLEIGHVLVENRRVVDAGSYVLNWDRRPAVRRHVQEKVEYLSPKMGENGSPWSLNWELLRTQGLPPEQVAEFYCKLLTTWTASGGVVVGHNVLDADYRVLRTLFHNELAIDFRLPGSKLWDTGAIAKATFLSHEFEEAKLTNEPLDVDLDAWLPQPQETVGTYCRRISRRPRTGLKWNMDLCVERFRLHEHPEYPQDRHRALPDAQLVRLLMEALRGTITRDNSGEHPCESPAALERSFEQDTAKRTLEARRGTLRAQTEAFAGFPERAERPAERSPERRRRQRRV